MHGYMDFTIYAGRKLNCVVFVLDQRPRPKEECFKSTDLVLALLRISNCESKQGTAFASLGNPQGEHENESATRTTIISKGRCRGMTYLGGLL